MSELESWMVMMFSGVGFRILDPCSSSLPKNCGGSPVEGYVLG